MADLTWRLYVYQPDGAIRSLLSPATASITSFGKISVAASGDCREMEFDALPSEFSGKARDRILFQVSTDGGSIYRSLFRGVITAAGDPRADTVRTYRAVGLSKRYEETLVEDVVIPGADVRSMAIDVVSSGTIPDGVHPFILTNFPGFSFSLGDRYPGRETKADALRALAAAVGAFIVPAGETYTYDGVTYSAGEAVPPARWGIDADGNPFFRRPQAAPLYLDEASRRVEVVWTRVSGETVFDRVTLLYGGGEYPEEARLVDASGVAIEPFGYPIARSFGSGDYEAEKRVELEYPLDFMSTGYNVNPSAVSGTINNLSNATDGDPSTYADANFDGGVTTAIRSTVGAAQYTEGYFRLRLAPSGEEIVYLSTGGSSPSDAITIRLYWLDASSATLAYLSMRLDPSTQTIGDPGLITIPTSVPRGVDPDQVAELQLDISLSEDSRIYEIEYLVPDVDLSQTASEELARSYFRSPSSAAAEVRYQGLGPVTQSLTLTPADGGADLDLTIERVEFRVTVEGGMETVYFVGEAFDADLEAERALIGQIAREATE